jgi:hypothetical protein
MVIFLCSFTLDYHGRGILPSSTHLQSGPSEHKSRLSEVQSLMTRAIAETPRPYTVALAARQNHHPIEFGR